MKILFLSHSFYPQIGGIESNSELLADAFDRAGHLVHMMTWTTDNTGREFPYVVTRNPGIKQLIDAHRWADIVFENNPCLRLGWPSLLFGKPVVLAINTWITRADGKITIRDKLKTHWWLKRCSSVIAVSDAVRKACWTPAVVIHNPYRTDNFFMMPTETRNRDFVFLGRLVSDKGAAQALEAIRRIRTTMNNEGRDSFLPSLTIIGDGPERKMLQQKVAENDLQDAVEFTGALQGESLRKSLNRHRFLLVPSAWEEPFGNVVLEAMACGCIPIASDGGGLPEAVGNAGLTFRRNDVSSLVEEMVKLMNDDYLSLKFSNAADAHLAAHHPVLVAEQYLQVLQKAVSDN